MTNAIGCYQVPTCCRKYVCFSCYDESKLVPGPLHTFRNLSEMYQNYASAGHPQKMSNYFNVIKPCLVKPLDLSLSVSDMIPIPQLHCHISVGNWGRDWLIIALGDQGMRSFCSGPGKGVLLFGAIMAVVLMAIIAKTFSR